MISRQEINFKFMCSLALITRHHVKWRDNDLGIDLEAITPKRKNGDFGKQKNYYFIDGVEKEFLDLDELIDFYNEKFKFEGDNPEHEVKYVKVISKRNID